MKRTDNFQHNSCIYDDNQNFLLYDESKDNKNLVIKIKY